MPWTKLTSSVNRAEHTSDDFFGRPLLIAWAALCLVISFYIYYSGIVMEASYSRKFAWNFSVTVALFLYVFIGKLASYLFGTTSRNSTAFIFKQFDSISLGLAALGMTLTNYHYDQSGYFSEIYLQTAAKILAAKLVIAFYCTSAFSSIFQYTSWLEITCAVTLYVLANAPVVYKLCNYVSYEEYFVSAILVFLCSLTLLVYISNIFNKKSGFRQGCPLCDVLLFMTMTAHVYATVDDFCLRWKSKLFDFNVENKFVTVWDTCALSSWVIMAIFWFTAFSQTIFAPRIKGVQFNPKMSSFFGILLYHLKRFLCSNIYVHIHYATNEIINV
ncbi:uncharacterized protein LOC125676850 [Ostrea edulis]|uniref:uncharacterized protein LOC125676850 n=1 Tax=Ostrea edulis TaxID=37623 RepID=UPI002095F6AC|nr:uncharacterized protein LOC125676850 [Ostrea edulis]